MPDLLQEYGIVLLIILRRWSILTSNYKITTLRDVSIVSKDVYIDFITQISYTQWQ